MADGDRQVMLSVRRLAPAVALKGLATATPHARHGLPWAVLLLGVGLLGGFTTFSAFSLEMMLLVERGQAGTAIAYALISVLAGLAALYLGLVTMRVAG